jgi:hypothetical protein
MAYNFPDNPTVGQIFDPFKWDGEKWIIAPKAGSGYALAIVSATAPVNPVDGCLWFEMDSGILFLRVNDGNSSQWVSCGLPLQDTTMLVRKDGDTMLGLLTLSGDPVSALQAAPRQYVDSRPVLVAIPFAGKPTYSVIAPMAVPVTVPSGLAGTVGYANSAATAAAVFTLNKITAAGVITALGTITVPAGAKSGFVVGGAGGSLVAGDSLQLSVPASPDSTLSDIGITILTNRVPT